MRASLLTAVKSTTRLTTVLVGPKCPAVVKSAEAEAEPTISIFELSDKHQAKLDLIADDLILYGDAGFTNDRLGKPSWSLRRADRLVRWLASLLRSKARDRSASPAVGRNAHRAADFPAQLAGACPKGIDVYFENVGGSGPSAAQQLRPRIPVCGLIAQYSVKPRK
jgi:hypothetical protein